MDKWIKVLILDERSTYREHYWTKNSCTIIIVNYALLKWQHEEKNLTEWKDTRYEQKIGPYRLTYMCNNQIVRCTRLYGAVRFALCTCDHFMKDKHEEPTLVLTYWISHHCKLIRTITVWKVAPMAVRIKLSIIMTL